MIQRMPRLPGRTRKLSQGARELSEFEFFFPYLPIQFFLCDLDHVGNESSQIINRKKEVYWDDNGTNSAEGAETESRIAVSVFAPVPAVSYP